MVIIASQIFQNVYQVEGQPLLVAASGWSTSPSLVGGEIFISQNGTLNISIQCRNDGTADGNAQIITNIAFHPEDQGVILAVAPGQTRTITNATVVTAPFGPGNYTAVSTLIDADSQVQLDSISYTLVVS